MTFEYILKASLCREPNCGDYTRDARMAHIENITVARSYAEPGYTDPEKLILFANWNYFPRGIDSLLESYGYEIEWSDEWTTCDGCNRAMRTNPDCWSWQPSFADDEHGTLCLDCLRRDPSDYLASLEDNPDTALTVEIDPAQHGYVKIESDFESGFHPGMTDNPRAIYERLSAQFSRILFKIDTREQFTTKFSVWRYNDRHTFYSESGFTLELSLEDARSCAHPGPCDEDVAALARVPYVAEQLDAIPSDKIRRELRESGGWDAEELSDDDANLRRLLWIAAGSIADENR